MANDPYQNQGPAKLTAKILKCQFIWPVLAKIPKKGLFWPDFGGRTRDLPKKVPTFLTLVVSSVQILRKTKTASLLIEFERFCEPNAAGGSFLAPSQVAFLVSATRSNNKIHFNWQP